MAENAISLDLCSSSLYLASSNFADDLNKLHSLCIHSFIVSFIFWFSSLISRMCLCISEPYFSVSAIKRIGTLMDSTVVVIAPLDEFGELVSGVVCPTFSMGDCLHLVNLPDSSPSALTRLENRCFSISTPSSKFQVDPSITAQTCGSLQVVHTIMLNRVCSRCLAV